MANDVLKLTWAADGDADEDELNLLDFVQGLTLDEGGWIPQVAVGDQATVTETMTFHARALSHDQLAGYVQVLDDWIMKVAWSQDYTQRQFVWLNARWKSETEIRRAPIYDLAYSLGSESSPFGVFLRDDSFAPALTIVITRGAYWEDISSVELTTEAMSATGGTAFFSAGYIVAGDVPARITRFQAKFVAPPLRYFWGGFRSSRNGTLANFVPVWSLKDAVYLLDTSSDTVTTADATTYNGVTRVQTIFAAGATLINRIRISASDVTANTADQRGMYTCLLRAKMSDTSIARVRVSSGFATAAYSNPYFVNPRVTVQGTSWNLYDMGLLRLPSIQREYTGSPQAMEQAAAIIDAERVSGSGNLHYDCLILIPYNDAYINLDGGTDNEGTFALTHPNFTFSVYDVATLQQVNIQTSGWGMPANNEAPLFVIAAQASADHALGVNFETGADIVRRWRTLRGDE